MRFLRLTLAYDGTAYFGWQWQPNRPTIQGVLEDAWHQVTGEKIRVVGSGRTDAGVHALGQAVSLTTHSSLDPAVVHRALNANLPPDVVVRQVCEAPQGFNAIDHSLGKRYRYLILDDRLRDPFSRHYHWHVRRPLDADLMNQAAQLLLGERDFKSFESAGSRRVSSVRTVRDLSVRRCEHIDGQRIWIEIEANGFLYNMVRNIVGTLVEVGQGKRPVEWVQEVLLAHDRRVAGMTAPARGLFLVKVLFASGVIEA